MKSAIISLLILTAVFLFVSHLKVTVKPFSVSLPDWLNGVGMLLLVAALTCFSVSNYQRGELSGFKKGAKAFSDQLVKDLEGIKKQE